MPLGENGWVNEPGGDLVIAPAPGLRRGLVIPAVELVERFSRSSGPGGQGVNTADSRVELLFEPGTSNALTQAQRERAVEALAGRLVGGRLTVVASEHRAQLRNRAAARVRLADLLREALAPPPPARRPTKPTRGSQQRRLAGKKRRADVKSGRGRIRPE
ncbi:aminoacyl-tRNA hydrolase [Terrabacter sp. MAHUQ-38]|nr:aminoacyl-tRNA hydrolase [Terrabacter sp. MAHUQ-38]